MANFFDNPDIQFHFRRFDLAEVVGQMERGYSEAAEYPYAPVNYEDALENYRRVLEVIGDLAANNIAPRLIMSPKLSPKRFLPELRAIPLRRRRWRRRCRSLSRPMARSRRRVWPRPCRRASAPENSP